MAIETTVTSNNGDRTLTIAITADSDKFDNLANDAAREAYAREWQNDDRFKTEPEGELQELQTTAYDDLTLQQKIAVLGLEAQRWLLHGAKVYYKNTAERTARDTAIEEIESRY